MIKLITLAAALLFTAAVAAELVASEKITQQVTQGSLEQTVTVGDTIKTTTIKYENVSTIEPVSFDKIGLKVACSDVNSCVVSGQINKNLPAQTVNPYLLLKDDEGKAALTQFDLNVQARPATLKVIKGELTQSVNAGDSISEIEIEYYSVSSFIYSKALGITTTRDGENNTLKVSGKVDEKTVTGQYKYYVRAINAKDDSDTLSVEVKINVQGKPVTVSVAENETQKVAAGDSIKPILFSFTGSKNYQFTTVLPGDFKAAADGENMLIKVWGVVEKNTADGLYTIEVEVTDSNTTAKAKATVEVVNPQSSSSVSSSSESGASSSSEVVKPETSSSAESSSSTAEEPKSSSSENTPGTSSSEHLTTIVVAKPSFKFGYANNELTVVLPTSSMVRVQVFDMMGHMVETFAESAVSAKSFSLAHLNKGNYVVRIESAHEVRTAKIIVK